MAVEAQDFEFEEQDTSSAGIVAEITWCGSTILTGAPGALDSDGSNQTNLPKNDDQRLQWNCSTSAPAHWMMPCPLGGGCGQVDPFHSGDRPPHFCNGHR
eukprot:COSAG02_NODE_4097_length_5787_cov_1.650492_3_plen_100_part_00